ncbi:MAG: hypothetical protein JWQ57_4554 [Mucilaginibacter sp.]|nr:hypothetical protein [Mucilaginibacter sp.]
MATASSRMRYRLNWVITLSFNKGCKKLFKIDEYLLYIDKTSLPLVLTNGTMSSDKRGL